MGGRENEGYKKHRSGILWTPLQNGCKTFGEHGQLPDVPDLDRRSDTGANRMAAYRLSKDGVPISYEIYGAGEPTLVFVHGWSCDARYWRAQLPYFSKKHRVVTLDLAGHGHSGTTRSQYTMWAFGEDVRAVTEAIGSRSVILIGHSMGGSVIAEAARLMPNRVIGLIGVDTLENIEYPMTREELKKMIAPLEKDFRTGSRQFVGEMISPKPIRSFASGFSRICRCAACCCLKRDERDDAHPTPEQPPPHERDDDTVHHRRSGEDI